MLSRLVSSLRQTLWLALAAIAFFSPMVLDVFCTDWHPFYGFSPNYPHIPASFPYDEPEHLLITAPRGKVALGLPAPKVRLTIDANSPRIIALELKGAPWPTAPPTETMTPYASATVPFHGEVTAWTTPAPTAEPALPLRCGKGKASLQLKIDPGYTFEDLGTSATAVRGWTSLVLIALIITKLNKLFPGFLTNLVVLVVLAVVFSRQAG